MSTFILLLTLAWNIHLPLGPNITHFHIHQWVSYTTRHHLPYIDFLDSNDKLKEIARTWDEEHLWHKCGSPIEQTHIEFYGGLPTVMQRFQGCEFAHPIRDWQGITEWPVPWIK